MPELLYFTELVGLKVYDRKGRRIGRIEDAALVPLIESARIDRLVVGGGWTPLTVRYDQVSEISLEGIRLRDDLLTPYYEDEYTLRIARDLLDQQIVDVNGRKVVRVNDVTFELRSESGFTEVRVLDIDIGVRSMVRRLLQGALPRTWIRAIQRPIKPNSIRWEFCNIIEPDPQRRLRLNISHTRLATLHPADLADIVEELSPDERGAIFETLDSEVAAEALSEVDPKMQASILESLETEKAADIIEEMAPDQAADVLAELEEETSEEILDEMEVEPKAEVRELLEFEEDTAGGMMNTEYIAVHETATVADALEAVKAHEDLLEGLTTLFVIDPEGRLLASVPVSKLFVGGPSSPVRELGSPTLISVPVDAGQNRVTELFDKYNILALPVLDEDGKLAGVITADDVISVLRQR